MNNGFGYETQAQTCEIVNAIKSEGSATRDLINANETLKLRDEVLTLKTQVSQTAQTQALESFIDAKIASMSKVCSC